MNPYRVKPDRRLNLRDLDPRESGDFKSEEEAEDRTEQLKQKLETLQERLYGERSGRSSSSCREWIPAARTEPPATS